MKFFTWQDKSGRGEKAKNIPLDRILDAEDEYNYDDESLHDWATEAEPGDEWDDYNQKYICTHEKLSLGTANKEPVNKISIAGNVCYIEASNYSNGGVALVAKRIKDGEDFLFLTINIADHWKELWKGTPNASNYPKFPQLILKNYSENTGIPDELVSNGFISPYVRISNSEGKFVQASLTKKWQSVLKPQISETKYMIEKANGSYYSRDMNGKVKWVKSPDLAYTFEKSEANSLLKALKKEDKTFNLKIKPYNKDWYKKTLGKTTTNMTITAQNYFTQADTFVSKLPQTAKEAHELVTTMKKDGIDNPFATGDSDIDEMGAELLKQANAVLSKSKSVITDKPKAAKPKSIKNNEKKVINIEAKFIRKDDFGRGLYKGSNGKMYIDVDGVAHDITNTGEPNTPMPNVVLLFPRVKPAKKTAKRKKAAPKKGKKTISVKKAKRIVRKVAATAVKQARKADAAKAPVTVKKLSLELQTIKSFVGMNGKTYKATAINAKHKAISNQFKAGKINDHQTTIKDIHTRLGKLISALNKANATSVKVTIEKGFYDKCKKLVAGAKVRIRTEFLSGINSHNKIDWRKVQDILNRMTDYSMDFDGEEETIFAATRLELQEAIDDKNVKLLQTVISEMSEWNNDFSPNIREQWEKLHNELLMADNALIFPKRTPKKA